MKHKERISLLKSRYIKTPRDILKMGLSPLSISVYLLLCSYTEDFNPTLVNISKHLGVSKNSACKAMRELCNAGVIRKTKQGRVFRLGESQTPETTSYQSEYEFTNPDKWVKPASDGEKRQLTKTSTDVSEDTDNNS